MDIDRIREILPHRYPFLLVDRVSEVEPGKRLKAYKNVTANEPFFNGHFPERPVMPGVLICEAMAQAAALLAYETSHYEAAENHIYLMGMDDVRFRRPVIPGDRLELEVEMVRQKGRIWRQKAVATVDGERAAECTLLAMIKPKDEGAP
ncbi:MAG: 3-hydroxyacyl-ACP dehydratase FabZ [Deltaproteobacteria bacterium]|nr:3-hydroxyacyl-ACP dehydratase FabZ [Deltaproteobacteria bacterium]